MHTNDMPRNNPLCWDACGAAVGYDSLSFVSQGVVEDKDSSQPAAVAPPESAADKKVTTAPAAVAAAADAAPASNAALGGTAPSNGSVLVDME